MTRARRDDWLELLCSLSLLSTSACALPPTRYSKTVWADPVAQVDGSAWQLASATCAGGRQLPTDQLGMVLRTRASAGGALVLEIETERFTCREQLVLALSPAPSPAPNLFLLEEQARTSGATCTQTKQPPCVVSFVQERGSLVLTGPVSALCGGLDAQLVFVPGPS